MGAYLGRLLALTLLVPGIAADDSHDAAALDDLAVLTDAPNAGSDLHDRSRWLGGFGVGFSCWLCCVDFSNRRMRALLGSKGEISAAT